MPPRGGGGAATAQRPAEGGATAPSDPFFLGNLWALAQMVMSRGCMPEDEAQKEFARITGKTQTDVFQQALDRCNHELQRLSLVLRRCRSPLTGALHVGVANLSADAPARAVGTRHTHAQREFFARVLETIATDPNANGGVCSASVPQLLNLDLSRPSAIASTAAANAAAAANAPTAPASGRGKKGKAPAAVKRDPNQSDDAADDNDAAANPATDDDDEDARNARQAAQHRLAREAVARMSMKDREETLAMLAREGWLEARHDLAGHYCIGPRSFIELLSYLMSMDIDDETREVWERVV